MLDTLFFDNEYPDKKARVFGPAENFQPCLVFVSKAKAYPQRALY